jgi:hypothetical protein
MTGLWITLGVVALLAVAGVLGYNYYFHAKIRPTQLKEAELTALNAKLEAIERAAAAEPVPAPSPEEALRESGSVAVVSPPTDTPPAPPAAARDPRLLVLTQRELNGLLSHNTELGNYLKVDLRSGAFDVTTVVPVPEDFPILGGKTLRGGIVIGLNKADGGETVLAVRSFTFLGVPLPKAWLEGLGIPQGENLLEELRVQQPWFSKFEEGIETIELSGGEMRIKLAQ